MKKILFASAMAVATLAAAPAFAGNGYVGLTGGTTEIDIGSWNGDANSFGIVGAGVTELKPGKGLQFDGAVSFNESDDIDDDTTFGGGLHLFHQQEASRWGGFVGVSASDDITTWDIGGEGQIFLNNVVLDGAVGYFNIDDVDVDGWGARTAASVFPNDNFSLTGGFGIATADGDGFDADGWTAGAGTEFQMSSQPISFSLNYSHSEIDDFDVEVDSVSVGINYNFGGGTLKDRATTGAGLRGLGLAGLFRY